MVSAGSTSSVIVFPVSVLTKLRVGEGGGSVGVGSRSNCDEYHVALDKRVRRLFLCYAIRERAVRATPYDSIDRCALFAVWKAYICIVIVFMMPQLRSPSGPWRPRWQHS